MNWDKINIKAILEVLRYMEKNTPTIDGEYAILYSDGKEQLKINYKNLDQ